MIVLLFILVVFVRVECAKGFVPSCFISEAMLVNVLGTQKLMKLYLVQREPSFLPSVRFKMGSFYHTMP